MLGYTQAETNQNSTPQRSCLWSLQGLAPTERPWSQGPWPQDQHSSRLTPTLLNLITSESRPPPHFCSISPNHFAALWTPAAVHVLPVWCSAASVSIAVCAAGLSNRGNDANVQGRPLLLSSGGRWSCLGFAAGDHVVSAAPKPGLPYPKMPSGPGCVWQAVGHTLSVLLICELKDTDWT